MYVFVTPLLLAVKLMETRLGSRRGVAFRDILLPILARPRCRAVHRPVQQDAREQYPCHWEHSQWLKFSMLNPCLIMCLQYDPATPFFGAQAVADQHPGQAALVRFNAFGVSQNDDRLNPEASSSSARSCC